jgi:hypothetical protein
MEPKGLDMGDYQERYQDYDIEVAVEQVLTGVCGLPSTPRPRQASRRRAKRSMPASPHSHKRVSWQAHSIKLTIFRLAGDRCAPGTCHSDHPYLF